MGEDDQHMVANVPITCIRVVCPPDGLPSVDDWMTTVISFLFTGSRLHREPLDLFILDMTKPNPEPPFLGVKKGFTRLMLATNSGKLLLNVAMKIRVCICFSRPIFLVFCALANQWFYQKNPRTAVLFLLLVSADLDPIRGKDRD